MLAVLTADLINSTHYDRQTLQAVMAALQKEFQYLEKHYRADFTIFRGDSFQGAIKNAQDALKVALLLKATVVKTSANNSNAKSVADVRISIGIGEAENYMENAVAESSGEAFYFSGRALDLMKGQDKTISLKTAFKSIDDEFEVSLKLLDTITDRWSTASAEVIYYLIKGYKQQEIADMIGRSQAAVNLRKKAANWDEIQLLLERYETVITKNYK